MRDHHLRAAPALTPRPHHLGVSLACLLAAFGGLAAACEGGSVPVDREEHGFDDGQPIDFGSEPWRARRRMDVDQLDASLRQVTGGIGWERIGGSPPTVRQEYFSTFSDTLGVPDYINSSSEDLTVSLLFAKFLDDAARSACRRLADRESGNGNAYDGEPQGTFAPADLSADEPTSGADIDAAMSSLLLRFHGRRVASDDDQVRPWRELYIELVGAEPDPPRRAWEGVCVALVTHPDFYTY